MARYEPLPYVRPERPRNLRLADLYIRSGEAQAEAELRAGAIKAQLFGDLSRTIGQTAGAVIQAPQLERERQAREAAQAQQRELGDLQLGQARRQVNDQENFDLAMTAGSRQKTLAALKDRPELYASAQKHFSARDDNMKRMFGDAAVQIAERGYTAEAAIAEFDDLIEQGFDDRKLGPFRDAVADSPDSVRQVVAALLEQSPDPQHKAMAQQFQQDARVMADQVGPGALTSEQMAMTAADPMTAARTRYSFGPGTADGPELMPTADQRRLADVEKRVQGMGGVLGPNGQIVMPPRAAAGPDAGTFEHYVTRKFGPNPTPEQVENARRTWGDAGRERKPPPTGLSVSQQRRLDSALRSFDAQPAVKKAQTMADAASFAESLNANTSNPADDQALIYAFAKAMDPESVVREGEYATVQRYSQSWAEKFGFDVARMVSNTTFLTAEARANMKATILSRFQATQGQYDNIRRSYSDRINKITGGNDGETYLTDYGAAFPGADQNRGGGDSPLSVTAPDGQVFHFPTAEAAARFRQQIGGQ